MGCYFVVTVTVTPLFVGFESVCGDAVWIEAVFTICCGAPDATTVNVTVAWLNDPALSRSPILQLTV
jgi:hypothetical protein